MNIPQWLVPPKPTLTGTMREPFINQRRQMRRIAFGATQEEVRAIAEAKAEAKRRVLNGLKKAHEKARARIAAECLATGETVAERKARMIREKYWRAKIKKLGMPKP